MTERRTVIAASATIAGVLASMGINAEVVHREARAMGHVMSALPVVGTARHKANGGQKRKRAIRAARLQKFRPR